MAARRQPDRFRQRHGAGSSLTSPKERIVAAALSAGATAVRITGAQPDPATAQRLRAAFARDDLAAWKYDDAYAAAASDPASLLAGARSVVCIAVAYAHPTPQPSIMTGRVSNYAWGGDYHAQLRAILDRVGDVAASFGAKTRIVCDAAPFAERAFAVRAGLGWAGKHTNLIVPGAGSFVFLGEAITTLELEPDAALRKTCGSCRRCVDVCPTGALRGDYTIDANRCISDLTQRPRGIPRAWRPFVGDWIWGCDLCQEVCPPTRRAPQAAPAGFAPQRDLARPDLIMLLALQSAQFKRRYAGSALGWRGAAVLRRNAAVVLGNSLDRSAVPYLQKSLAGDPSAMVREHAGWALGRIGSPSAISFLRKCLEREKNAAVLEELQTSLVTAGAAQAF